MADNVCPAKHEVSGEIYYCIRQDVPHDVHRDGAGREWREVT